MQLRAKPPGHKYTRSARASSVSHLLSALLPHHHHHCTLALSSVDRTILHLQWSSRLSDGAGGVGQVRVLRAAGGLHPGVHRGREGRLRRAVAVRALLRGGEGGGQEARDGGGAAGPHGLLRRLVPRQGPRAPGRRRHAPDAAPPPPAHLHLQVKPSEATHHSWRAMDAPRRRRMGPAWPAVTTSAVANKIDVIISQGFICTQ
ncbi:hypothetical protein VPH35_074413 [Triticum aestivum]